MSTSRFLHHSPNYMDTLGNFGLAYHLELIKDQERVGQICAALDEVLTPETIHCELGIGTGIFSIYAAALCKKVIAVEQDPAIYAFAKQNIEASGFADKIELHLQDALDFRPSEKVDSLLVEMMSTWCINEPQIPIMNHARRHILKPNAQTIPQSIVNLVELGNYDFQNLGVTCKASIAQFTGVKSPRLMSCSSVFNRYGFDQIHSLEVNKSIPIQAQISGVVNCVRLSSLVQLSDSHSFYSTDSLMPLTIAPLHNPVQVRAGEDLIFSADYQLRTSVDEAVFRLDEKTY